MKSHAIVAALAMALAGCSGENHEATGSARGATVAVSAAAGPLPCDIYGAAGTPCVAAHSTVRALYAGYGGRLYQVQRASGGTLDIGLLSTGGYANAASQDSFCANTSCIITVIYDQSPQHNDLTIAGAGTAGAADRGASANALPITAGGHPAYGVFVTPGIGYRHPLGAGVARSNQPEGMYMVASGTHVNSDCCFDYGNVEAAEDDTGAGHMDALNVSTICGSPGCSGLGPWVQADLENGIFQGAVNASNQGNASSFVTAILKNDGVSTFALKGANSQSGPLTTWYSGALPAGYAPMQKEGSVVLGTGGDNSNRALGSFFEGVMTTGYPSDSADTAVQANIVSVGYAGATGPGTGGTITVAAGKCVDVAGDDVGGNGGPVQLWDCQAQAADQRWTHYVDNTLRTLGRCLDIVGDGTAAGAKVELWDCDGVGGQVWIQQANGSLLNPQSGRCLDDPSGNTANGTRLQIWDCNGTPAQQFAVNGGTAVIGPRAKCIDVAGDDNGGNGTPVQLWDCLPGAADQHWFHNANGSLSTLGRCLDLDGNGTADGTKLELWDCNGVGGQVWVQQPNGSLLNPQSGRCLDDPSGNVANGTLLQLWDCNGLEPQEFSVNGGGAIVGPGGKCIDVAGDDTGGDGTSVQLWDCQASAGDQRWNHNANGSLSTLGRCLDIVGNGTAAGAQLQLWDCNGVGGQVWVQQPNGTLMNPQSGRCLDDPSGNTANGTRLQIWDCNGAAAQSFVLH